jgi:hypothetical protein
MRDPPATGTFIAGHGAQRHRVLPLCGISAFQNDRSRISRCDIVGQHTISRVTDRVCACAPQLSQSRLASGRVNNDLSERTSRIPVLMSDTASGTISAPNNTDSRDRLASLTDHECSLRSPFIARHPRVFAALAVTVGNNDLSERRRAKRAWGRIQQ